MKSPRVLIAIMFTAVVLLTEAVAQTGAIRVSVPFEFSVANQTLPPGTYLVAINGSLLRVENVEGTAATRAMTINTGGIPNENLSPRLVFHCYGERRFLAQAWIGEVNMGHQLFASAQEVEYARATKQENVTVAAVRVSK